MTEIKIKSEAVSSGSGDLRASDLLEFCQQIPKDAIVKVVVHSSQHEGDSWRLFSQWEGDTKKKPTLNYPPGVRSAGSQFGGGGHFDDRG